MFIVAYIITKNHLQWDVCELDVTWGSMKVHTSAVSAG